MSLPRTLLPALALSLAALAAQPTLAARAVEAATCQRPASGAPRYLHADAALATALVGPPPAEGSAEARFDLAAVLAAQRAARGSPRRALAIADSLGSCARFADALGREGLFDAPAAGDAAQALAFLDRAAIQASGFGGAAKRVYLRARPYVHEPRVERLADVAPGLPLPDSAKPGYYDERDHTSYPSGHGAFGATCAILMAGMVPERSAQLFARGRQFGESRIIVGAHYPRDIEAGRTVGAAAVALMHEDACFGEDQAAARRALRAALGLAEPAATPAATPAVPAAAPMQAPAPPSGG
jgi:acid phosphatase (class A)